MNTPAASFATASTKRKLKKIVMLSLTCPAVNIILSHRSKLLRQPDLGPESLPHEARATNRRNARLTYCGASPFNPAVVSR